MATNSIQDTIDELDIKIANADKAGQYDLKHHLEIRRFAIADRYPEIEYE